MFRFNDLGEPVPRSSPSPPRLWIGLALLTAVGACLRIFGLNTGLWWDEIYFLIVSVRHPLSQIVTVFPGDNQHPLYSVLAWLSVQMVGEHAWTLRLPAAVFGIASIPMLYFLAAEITSRVEAFLAAAFLAVSYHHVWFSQDARGYSALAFWALASTFFLLQAVKTERFGPWAGYAVAASLGVYTHLTMMFVIASQGLVCAAIAWESFKRGRNSSLWKRSLQGFALAGLLILLLYAPILTQVQNFFMHRPSSMKAVSTPRWAIWETVRVLILGLGSQGVLIGAALIVACGGLSYLRQSRTVFGLFALPALFTALGALAARGTMYPRFYFSLIGFAIIILVRGIVVIPEWIASRCGRPVLSPLLTGVLAAIFVISSGVSLVSNYKYPKQDYAGAIRFLEVEKAGEPVVTAGAAAYPLLQYYEEPWANVDSAAKLRQLCAQARPFWVVYTMPRYLEAAIPGITDVIHTQFTIVRVFHGTLGDGDVFVARFQPA